MHIYVTIIKKRGHLRMEGTLDGLVQGGKAGEVIELFYLKIKKN